MLRRKKELDRSKNDPDEGVFGGGSLPDDQTDRPSIPGDPPRGGGSSPTSGSDAMVVAPVQILVGAK